MTPYQRAHAAYHRHGPPGVPWTDALDFHLQTGALFINTPSLFIMARMVPPDATPEQQLSLTLFPGLRGSSVWHVWAAAGDLRDLLEIPEFVDDFFTHGVSHITYQRHGGTLRTHPMELLDAYIRSLVPSC